VIIPYFPIRDEALRRIILLKLGRIKRRILETHRVELRHDDNLVDEVARRCTEVESGARNVDNILTNTLLPEVSRLLLERIVEGSKPGWVRVGIGADGAFEYSLPDARVEREGTLAPAAAPALA
jgi:type VI secretion system protein VasG